ncbi:MAG TPA: glycosyltransferase family 87 protein [Verrucomicrobiae bacterium]|nr:glycosyltransferase family 87 protein [Verrucomicrobiae bacterium]
MSGWNRILRSPVFDAAVLLIAVLHVAWIAQMLPMRIFSFDFNNYYMPSRMIQEGRDPYRTPLAEESRKYGFEYSERIPVGTNPPLLLWVFAPLTLLPPRPAFWVWVAVESGSLVVILWLTKRLLNGRLTQRAWLFFFAAALSSAPVYWNFAFAHVEMTIAALLLAAYAWHKNGKHALACATILLVGMIKIYPLVLLPWFVWRSGFPVRKRLLYVVALLAGIAAIVLVTGVARWQGFFARAMPCIKSWSVGQTFTFTLPSFVINVGQVLQRGTATAEPGRLWWDIGVSIGLATILASYAFCAVGKKDEDVQFSVLCGAMLAGGLTAWGYYFVILIFPVGLATARMVESPSWRRALVFAVLLMAMNSQGPWNGFFFGWSPIGRILLNYVPLYGLLGFCFFLAKYSTATAAGQRERPDPYSRS